MEQRHHADYVGTLCANAQDIGSFPTFIEHDRLSGTHHWPHIQGHLPNAPPEEEIYHRKTLWDFQHSVIATAY